MGRDDREGSLGNLEERTRDAMRKPGIDHVVEQLFFVDSNGISTGELASSVSTEYIVYDRCNVAILGTASEEEESSESLNSQGNRCFNCGSPQHMVTNCTEPLNRPLIALSRAMYEFFKDPGRRESERLHEYEEHRAQRLRFSEFFNAGSISGELLREALGIDVTEHLEGDKRELPWLWRMLDWGYPPGWVSEEDPKIKVRARIEGESIWTDDLDATIIIDNPQQTSSVEHLSISNSFNPCAKVSPTVIEQTDTPKRWAHYPTALFSSEHLVVYDGVPLPPLVHDGLSPDAGRKLKKHHDIMPPWRCPGAFSAFGPAGWQAYVKQNEFLAQGVRKTDFSARNSDSSDEKDAAQSDMDLSE